MSSDFLSPARTSVASPTEASAYSNFSSLVVALSRSENTLSQDDIRLEESYQARHGYTSRQSPRLDLIEAQGSLGLWKPLRLFCLYLCFA